jgi:hypothetical protein
VSQTWDGDMSQTGARYESDRGGDMSQTGAGYESHRGGDMSQTGAGYLVRLRRSYESDWEI